MRRVLDIQKQLVPDLLEIMRKRYTILHHVMLSGNVGRRTLAGTLGMTERVLRGEIDFLKTQGLLEVDALGMRVSEAGRQLVESFRPLLQDAFGLTELEERIRNHYGLKQVIIVPGDSDASAHVKMELGRAGAAALRKAMKEANAVVAVAGGSTMAEVASHLTSAVPMKGVWFVPARGGLGESVELQANTIASTMAKKTGGQYRLLHVPDHLSEEAYQSLMLETGIVEIIQAIRAARIVVHGIGDAMVMAKRRKVDEATRQSLVSEGALAEAFGYYFDRQGRVVHKMPTIGLRIEDIEQMETVIGVAGGKSKGEAIDAVLRYGHEDVLVTDEAAALQIAEHMVREKQPETKNKSS
ncbi:central glycolytic gene regulator [Gordoniibacillus kamchatkensis]|uniref:Central glycolytic gene regulator n=1 Tax=Gordoniibacillus kamchatkensis TaxID=1590651 RepID=A0ABR5ACY9_9BACL|nr:sugar-binding domain-containing protein [Paenibacillus sp. VKM B-2647]KIL38841.1 central glycolytic gene regulator [Paenibacillus sp. VKM B-2647]